MNKLTAQSLTGLKAREIVHPDHLPRDENSRSGDQRRFQLGEEIPHIVHYTETTESGREVQKVLRTTLFKLVAYGSSFQEAVDMYYRLKGIKPDTRSADQQASDALAKLTAA